MDTVTVDSNHWLGWSQSAALLSASPERYQSASYGEMSLNISHLPPWDSSSRLKHQPGLVRPRLEAQAGRIGSQLEIYSN